MPTYGAESTPACKSLTVVPMSRSTSHILQLLRPGSKEMGYLFGFEHARQFLLEFIKRISGLEGFAIVTFR